MRYIKQLGLVVVMLLFIGSTKLCAQEQKGGLSWYTDVYQAHSASVKSKRPIFAFFTGSDWCGWCKRLQAAVFAKPEFQAWAKKSVILLELDFPHNKKLPEQQAKQNAELQQFFQVQGYPTVWIFDMVEDKATKKYNITARGQLGYPRATAGKEAETFVASANDVLKNKK